MAAFALTALVLGGCQKMDQPALGDFPKDTNPPDGPLRLYAAMDGTSSDNLRNGVDSILALFPSVNGMTQTDGISGKAFQGVDKTAILYPAANGFGAATSFSLSIWLKANHTSRAEFIFSVVDQSVGWPKNSIFLMAEQGTDTDVALKLFILDQWLAWEGDHKFNYPLTDNNWHHLGIVYDQSTSLVTWYFDGNPVANAPASVTEVKNAGAPRGALNLSGARSFIVGGTNQHVSVEGATDDWMKSFTGSVDQVRVYATALSASDIKTLFDTKK